MRHKRTFLFPLILLSLSVSSYAQLWSGILSPTHGTGACTLLPTGTYAGCGVDWTQTGVPGGIPSSSWTQSGSTITSTGSDQTSQIQTALKSCGTSHYVLLASGTFVVSSTLTI